MSDDLYKAMRRDAVDGYFELLARAKMMGSSTVLANVAANESLQMIAEAQVSRTTKTDGESA